MKEIKINVSDQINSYIAVSTEDGELLFDRIDKILQEKDVLLILDWSNITIITSTFLNASIGQLYYKYKSLFLRKHFKMKGLSKENLEWVEKIIESAKQYRKDKKKIKIILSDIVL